MEKWNGRFYTFNNEQIRLCLIDDTVWMVESDVRKFISPAVTGREQRLLGLDYGIIPGFGRPGYSERGLLRLLALRLQRRGGEAELKKFRTWLQSEAIPNVRRLPTSSAV